MILNIRLAVLVYRKTDNIIKVGTNICKGYYIFYGNLNVDLNKRRTFLKEILYYICGIITLVIHVFLTINYFSSNYTDIILTNALGIHFTIFLLSIVIYQCYNLIKMPVLMLFFLTFLGVMILILLFFIILFIVIVLFMLAMNLLLGQLNVPFFEEVVQNAPFRFHELLLGLMYYMTEGGNFWANLGWTITMYIFVILIIPKYIINNLKSSFTMVNYFFNMLLMILVFISNDISENLHSMFGKYDSLLFEEFLSSKNVNTVSEFNALFNNFIHATFLPYIIGSFIGLVIIEQLKKLYKYNAKKNYCKAIEFGEGNDFESTIAYIRKSLVYGGEEYEMHIRNNVVFKRYLKFFESKGDSENKLLLEKRSWKILLNNISFIKIQLLLLKVDLLLNKAKGFSEAFINHSKEIGKQYFKIIKSYIQVYLVAIFIFYLSSELLKLQLNIEFFNNMLVLITFVFNKALLLFPLVLLYYSICFFKYNKELKLISKLMILIVSIIISLLLIRYFFVEFYVSYDLFRNYLSQ